MFTDLLTIDMIVLSLAVIVLSNPGIDLSYVHVSF